MKKKTKNITIQFRMPEDLDVRLRQWEERFKLSRPRFMQLLFLAFVEPVLNCDDDVILEIVDIMLYLRLLKQIESNLDDELRSIKALGEIVEETQKDLERKVGLIFDF